MITSKYSFFQGRVPLYCIGDRDAIKQAIRNLFTNEGFPIHDQKENTLIHYPSGWTDRMLTGYLRFSNMNEGPYSDSLVANWHVTSNPIVTLVSIDYYFKKNKFRADEKFQTFLRSVMDGLGAQFSMFDIPLLSHEGFRQLVREHPELSCSPVWELSHTQDPRGFAELRASS
jgi:hypothetical protein